ncbi:hypothetical protein F5887DRAFT_1081199 [Amanita rubescens]|nr:hypothetical protein F5887DRAFT_1081199 [Amanita rubescens]
MRGLVFQTDIQPTQEDNPQTASAKRLPRPPLGKSAQNEVNERRRVAAANYNHTVDELWSKIRQESERIAVEHHKSLQKVSTDIHMRPTVSLGKHCKISSWNAFIWKKRELEKENQTSNGAIGKGVLQDLVKKWQDEYHKLSPVEKAALNKEYEQHKAQVAKGTRISSRSKVRDVVTTVGVVENMLAGLRSRSGMETQVFAACGSVDIPLKSISISTPGVQDFMEKTMHIDQIEYLGKMEGYALQGVKGAASNHNERRSTLRAQGTTYWKKLTQEEFEQLEDERDAQIESGKINTPARRTCSDKGKKRKARAHDEDSDPEEHSHSNKRKKTSRRSRNSDDAGVGASRADSDNETDGEYKPNSTDKHPTVSQHQQANRCAKR